MFAAPDGTNPHANTYYETNVTSDRGRKWLDALTGGCATLHGAMTTNTTMIDVEEEVHAFDASVSNFPTSFDFNSECDDEFKLNSMLETNWRDIKKPRSEAAQQAYEDEARISAFRELVFKLRTDAGLTQRELATRMGTTQSAIARMEGGGTRPTLQTFERLAAAVGRELIVGVGAELSSNRTIAKLVRDGHAVVRRAS